MHAMLYHQTAVIERFDLDHILKKTKPSGGKFMATKSNNGAMGRGKKEAPSENSRWRADLNTLLVGLVTVLFGRLYMSINDRIGDLSARMETGFRDVNERLDRVEQRFDQRLDRVEQGLDESSQTLQTLFFDYINKQGGAKNGITSPFATLAEAEKVLTPAIKATLDTLSFGNKNYSEFQLRSKLIQYVKSSDILEASREKHVELYKIHLAMAAYYYNKHKKQP